MGRSFRVVLAFVSGTLLVGGCATTFTEAHRRESWERWMSDRDFDGRPAATETERTRDDLWDDGFVRIGILELVQTVETCELAPSKGAVPKCSLVNNRGLTALDRLLNRAAHRGADHVKVVLRNTSGSRDDGSGRCAIAYRQIRDAGGNLKRTWEKVVRAVIAHRKSVGTLQFDPKLSAERACF